ncbi:NAD(P)/FAD-dependent oxidoreductase [Desulforamulus ferrireducens]|uniref:FAD-dependent oxidoreductase n=1 Tax=Desulforamulus ferrireducens TaxID=1833852 RepID=A0A1S6IV54_9FIRM|nr:NAD(P)/FAD-dependent oxidoreductase [Desulforamulus ferrireducens]AQS58659.1 FAD-dependent oxidoreductase [Desulforamulus ferrireducens]
MKVAIVGAGIAGLSCALELEKQGIQPIIFEQKHRIGSPFPYSPVLLNFLLRPVKNQLQLLKKNYGIELKPISGISSIQVQGPNTRYTITGNLGHIVHQGQEQSSIESQLLAGLKSPIHFEQSVKVENLLKQFDYLVVADGSQEYAKSLGIWQSKLRAWIRGATILGHFNPEHISYWFNTSYAKSGFASLVPMSTERASLLLMVPYITQNELPNYWSSFLHREKINPENVMNWDIEYELGLVYPHRIGNTFLIGNSGGFVSSFLGQGVYFSIASGVEAARAIALGSSYEKKMRSLCHILERHARIRQLWDRLNNKDLDRVLTLLGSPPVKYPLFQTNLDVLPAIDPLLQYLVEKIPADEQINN